MLIYQFAFENANAISRMHLVAIMVALVQIHVRAGMSSEVRALLLCTATQVPMESRHLMFHFFLGTSSRMHQA